MQNLPDQLQAEQARIYQSLLNVDSPWFQSGVAPTVAPYQWPQPDRIEYQVGGKQYDPGGLVYLILSDIHIGDFGPILWDVENQTGHPEAERYEEEIKVAAGDTYTRTISHTYSEVTTLEQATKLGFEGSVKTTFGGEKIFAQAELEAKVSREYNDKFGSTKSFSQTDSSELHIVGPADRTYIFQRKKVNASRHVQCQPLMAYGIEIKRDYNTGAAQTAGHYERVNFPDQETFLQMIRGLAPDSVGRRIYTTPVWDYNAQGYQFPESDGGSIAPFFRAHPQPNQELVHSVGNLVWTANYVSVLSQSLTYVDNATGKSFGVDAETGREWELAYDVGR